MLNPVRSLLELPDLSDDVTDLTGRQRAPQETLKLALESEWPCADIYHPHLGEVNQAFLGEVGRPLLDESQVGQVHAKVGHARRVTAANTRTHTRDTCTCGATRQ